MMPSAVSQVAESVCRAVTGLSVSHLVIEYGMKCYAGGKGYSELSQEVKARLWI